MSFTENPRSALCSAGVCCGACGVEAELKAYAPLVRSVAWRYAGRFPNHPPPPSPNGAQKHKAGAAACRSVFCFPFLRRFCLFALDLRRFAWFCLLFFILENIVIFAETAII